MTRPSTPDAPLNNARPAVAGALRMLTALDRPRNMHGPLGDEGRARIFAYLDRPSFEHWKQTRNILVSHEPMATLWNLARLAGLPDEYAPSTDEVLTMLESLPA